MRRGTLISRREALTLALGTMVFLAGCVDQHPRQTPPASDAGGELRLALTSVTVAHMCDRLGLDCVVGVPQTSRQLPARYDGVERVGLPMSPDLEKLSALRPHYVIAPQSLEGDLLPQFSGIGLASIFVDLQSVEGLFASLVHLGQKFDRVDEAQELVRAYEAYVDAYRVRHAHREGPRALVLMGLPGSYVVATEHSYVGSLAALAGAHNVYQGFSEDAFVNVSTEDMLAKDPDVILRAAHGLPDQARRMFAHEFETNDIWRHFRAVQDGRVFDLPDESFGMSANFDYPRALEELEPLLYGPRSGGSR